MSEDTQEAQLAIDAILRNDFESFLHKSVRYLNPGASFLPNWHIQAIAYQLDRIRRGEITRLIINMPPRHLKSLTVSVAFTAFLLGHAPWHRILCHQLRSLASSRPMRSMVSFRILWCNQRPIRKRP